MRTRQRMAGHNEETAMRSTRQMVGTVCALVLVGIGIAALGAQTTERSSGPSEGIRVHGDWTITIRNEDGSVASRHEFSNALQSSGGSSLAGVLAGRQTPGRWRVELVDSAGGICGGLCLFGQGIELAVNVTSGTLQLTGSKKATLGGGVVAVATAMEICSNTIAPASCTGGPLSGFTSKTLNAPIPVQANQTIDVTVAISFS